MTDLPTYSHGLFHPGTHFSNAPVTFRASWAGLFEAGLRQHRVVQNFEFRYESVKRKFSLNVFANSWWLDGLKNNREKIICNEKKAFEQKKKKPGLKFNPG